MRAACLQLRVDLCQRRENTARALKMAELAIDRGADVLVSLRCSSQASAMIRFLKELPYPSLEPFMAFAQDHDCLIIGSLMGGKYNLGFCLEPEDIQFQPKIHPFDQEKLHFLGGGCTRP